MKTPNPNDPTIEGLEHFNPEEVEKSAIMKAIESLKQDMNNYLKEFLLSGKNNDILNFACK